MTPLSPAPSADDLERELSGRIAGEVRFDLMSRGLYSTDASIYQIPPVGVVFPRDHADVVTAMQVAAQFRVPILPRGGGTSLSGQSIGAALVLDFSRHMNQILELDPEKRLVRVQAGVVLEQLNAFLRPYGLQFGPDVSTASRAALGGMIGNNSAGSHSIVHGKTLDHVRELRVVLSDGSTIAAGPLDVARLREKQSLPGLEGDIYRRLPRLIDENRRDIIARYPRLIRRVSGYNLDAFVPEFQESLPVAPSAKRLDAEFPDRREFNLAKLFVGAEGTLGIVTEALLHAVPLPKERGVACLLFTTMDTALEAVGRILECQPSAVEVLDKLIVELSRENLQYKHYLDFVEGSPAALLIVEFSGEKKTQIDDGFALLEQKLHGQPGLERIIRADLPERREQLWRCREAGAPLLLSIPGARKPIAFVEDAAVEPSRLPEFTKRFREILTRHGAHGAYYGHASVGCLHIRPMIDTKSAADLVRLKAISDDIIQLVVQFHGSMSGEHGDGLARSYHNPKLFGPRLFAAFQEVKRLFDPHGLLNPGKVADTPSPIENLRYGDDYAPDDVHEFQDFSKERHLAGGNTPGFLAAAEMCNGSGVCRKTHTGTMCPSFMVTRDEEHSTRGRANALRLALSGQLPAGSLTSQRMYDVLDLCLMCKGCKAECPSNVDVAKLKVEFLAHYHQAHRPSWGTILLANAPWLNRLGSATAPLSNWLPRLPGSAWLAEWLFGIDRRRPLPRFHRQSFQAWFASHTPPLTKGGPGGVARATADHIPATTPIQNPKSKIQNPDRTVVLLDDCLTSYCEPHVNRAAVELLEAAGYTVQLAGLWCCGRPAISKGLIEQGKSLARRNVGKLLEFVDQGWPILGCEPSCLLTLVDEYPDLFPSAATERVKQNAFLVDHWLAQQAAAGNCHLQFSPRNETALLHGHCQQKALVGLKGSTQALSLIPGLIVKPVDSGCCGMAGSFGYEHFDVSMQIGDRALFPAVKAHETGPLIAPGFSCRHQIAAGTGRTALHPVELLAAALP